MKPLCPYCQKIMRLGRTWRLHGSIRGGIKRGNNATLLRDCINANCPGKGIEKLLQENYNILGKDLFDKIPDSTIKKEEKLMNNIPQCPVCNSKLISLHSPNHYLCQSCSKLYEIDFDGKLQEYTGGK